MLAKLLLAVLLLGAVSSVRFCEVSDPEVTLYTTLNEVQQVQLNKHFRGYDLSYESSNPEIVAVYEPYHIAEEAELGLQAGYRPLNLDGKNSQENVWTRDGVLVAEGNGKSIGIGYGQFKNDLLPKIDKFVYFDLPQEMNCYSGRVYDNILMNVVVDCVTQKTLDDTFCLLTYDGKTTCNSYDPIVETGKRVSLIYTTSDNEKYLLSAATTQNIKPLFQNETFINIYHIIDGRVDFNNIVDRKTLGMDSLSITDMELVSINGVSYILISDIKYGLITFRYKSDNTIGDVNVMKIEGSPTQIEITPYSEWVVATPAGILLYNFQQTGALKLVKTYELDGSDTDIVDIQSSINHISVRTSKNVVYTYNKQDTSLQYLLNREQISDDTVFVVSPFFPRTFHINGTHMRSVAMTSGYLYIGKVTQGVNVTITAKSSDLTCKINLVLKTIVDKTKIYQKKDVPMSYRFESEDTLRFYFNDYFGGSNLKYKINTVDSKDIKYDLQHFKAFTQKIQNDDYDFFRIAEIDHSSYWFITFAESAISFYKCTVDGESITCNEDKDAKIKGTGKVLNAETGRLENNNIVIFFYYADRVAYKVLGVRGYSIIFTYQPRYSSITIGKRYQCFVEKELNRISFYNGQKLQIISTRSLTADQLDALQGFYPRKVYADPKNPNIFYIKFPSKIVTIAYFGGEQIEILAINKISDTYISDDNWDILIGTETFLLFNKEGVFEYVRLPDNSLQMLHQIAVQGNVVLPAKYQWITDSAFIVTDTGSLQFIRMNQNAIDSEYYQMTVPQMQNGNADWAISESWLQLPGGQAYYQFKRAALVITSNVSNGKPKEDFKLDLSIANAADTKDVQSDLTAYNYPNTVKPTSANGILALPKTGDSKIFDLNLTDYFNGPIADVTISCPFTIDNTLTLIKPFQRIKDSDVVKQFDDIEKLEDNTGVVTLHGNSLTVSDLNNNAVNSFGIDSTGDCKWMDINELNIVVLCKSSYKQEIAWFTYLESDIKLQKIYQLPSEAHIQNPFEIACSTKDGKLTVLMHDKLINVYNSPSTIKIVEITDTVVYGGEVDSTTFGVAPLMPINSISVTGKHMLAAIGNVGLGYANLEIGLASVQFIDLRHDATIKEYLFDDSQFLRVLAYGVDIKQKLSVFISVSNTFSYVVHLNVLTQGVSYGGVQEIYNKYGHQRPINWVIMDSEHIVMAFYNMTTSVESIVLYKRSTEKINNFFAASHFTIPYSSVRPPKATLVDTHIIQQKSSLLFIDESAKPSAPATLGLYNITGKYAIQATYKKAGSFDVIKVTASNDMSSATRNVKVSFEGGSVGGLKWYAVVIVICLVLIAVGVAFGLYLKMKARRSDSKKVSLFTENEDVDEVI